MVGVFRVGDKPKKLLDQQLPITRHFAVDVVEYSVDIRACFLQDAVSKLFISGIGGKGRVGCADEVHMGRQLNSIQMD